MMIKETVVADIPALQQVVRETGLFPAEMLPDMLADAEDAVWLTCHVSDQPAGFCFAKPEMLADGVWNMLALGVLPSRQGQGIGNALVTALEKKLGEEGQRILIVDTSSTAEFAPARAFYLKAGYVQEARIRDDWAEGDDKVTFRKRL